MMPHDFGILAYDCLLLCLTWQWMNKTFETECDGSIKMQHCMGTSVLLWNILKVSTKGVFGIWRECKSSISSWALLLWINISATLLGHKLQDSVWRGNLLGNRGHQLPKNCVCSVVLGRTAIWRRFDAFLFMVLILQNSTESQSNFRSHQHSFSSFQLLLQCFFKSFAARYSQQPKLCGYPLQLQSLHRNTAKAISMCQGAQQQSQPLPLIDDTTSLWTLGGRMSLWRTEMSQGHTKENCILVL